MSRHLLLNRPNRHVVLGWDEPLRAFFGQVFRGPHRDRPGNAIAGWPTRSGLGRRRPVTCGMHITEDLAALTEWAKLQIPDEFETEPQAAYHLGLLAGLLSRECYEGTDAPEVPLPDCLKGLRA